MPGSPSPDVAPDLHALLGSHATSALHEGAAAAYGVWSDGRLGFLNRGWFEFAQDNGGDAVLRDWGLGASIWAATPPPLREFYQAGFARAADDKAPWTHTYECSSPELLRKFHMIAYPLSDRALLKQCMHCRRVLRADASTWDWIPELVGKPRPNMTGGLCDPCLAHHYPKARRPPR